MRLDELVIRIGADISSFETAVNNVKSDLKGLEGYSQGAASRIRSGIESATKIFVAGGIVAGGVGAVFAKDAADMEKFSTIMQQLYGDVDTAGQKLKWIFDFAKSTPFEVPELVEAFVKLKAYGIEGDTVLRTLGDTASAMGKSVSMAVEALADAQTGEFERLKEFGIKAVEITKENAESLGVSAEKAGQTVLLSTDKYGKQRVDIINRNNREIITSTLTSIWNDKYAGGMAKQSQTLWGMVSNIKDSFSQAGLAVMGFDITTGQFKPDSLYIKIKDVAQNIMQTLQEIDFSEIAVKVEAVVNRIVAFVRGLWEQLQPTIENLKSIFQDMGTIITTLFGSFEGNEGALKPVVDVINAVTGAIAKLIGWLKENPEIAKLIFVIAGAFIGWAYIVPAIMAVVGGVTTLMTIMSSAGMIMAALGGPIGLLVLAISFLYLAWTTNLFGIRDHVANAVSLISEKWTALTSFISEHKDTIVNILTLILGPIGAVIFAFQNWDKIKEAVSNISGWLTETLSGLATKAWDWGKNLIKGFVDGIKGMLGSVANVGADIANTIAEYIGIHSPAEKGPLSHLMEWGPNLVSSYADGITRNLGMLDTAFMRMGSPQFGVAGMSTGKSISIVMNPTYNISGASAGNTTDLKTALEAHDRDLLREIERKVM